MAKLNHDVNEFQEKLEAYILDQFELEQVGLNKQVKYIDEKSAYNLKAHLILKERLLEMDGNHENEDDLKEYKRLYE
jgi:hypothetical protein